MSGVSRARLSMIILAVLMLTPATVVVAQSMATHTATAEVTYITDSDVAVTLGDDRTISSTPFADSNTFRNNTLIISGSNADIRATDATFDGDPISARNIDVTGSLTVNRSDLNRNYTVESGDANLLQVRDYQIGDGNEDLAYDSNSGLTITLRGLTPNIGVGAVDSSTGNALTSTTTDGSGTATFDLPSGTQTIRLKTAPGDLEVRNESAPDELIDNNVELRARLFSGDQVIERTVTDGTVSLDGVPKDEELTITVKEENADYVYRRITIDSAIETPEIYLLPTSVPSAEIEFNLRDDTGRFDQGNTKLFVEKPINRSGNTEYRVISGDRLGPDGTFPTILEDSERYRIRIVNDAGEQRVLGSYTVQGAEVVSLPIGDVTFGSDVDEGAAVQASLQEAADSASHDHEIKFTYVDPKAETSEIDIEITNESGGNIRPLTTENVSGSTSYTETYPITDSSFNPDQDTATLSVEATRGTEIVTFEKKLGNVPDVFTNTPLSTQAIELLSLGSIVAVFGLLAIISAPLAALVGTGYAGLLSLVGLAPIPMPWVVLAGVVGIMATVGQRRT